MKKLAALPRVLVAVVALVLLFAVVTVLRGGGETRTVTVNFSRAVAIFPSSEVRILGVKVGEVKTVVPEGSTVRVTMEYDAEYSVPADAQAVIITPTLTADRFIQLTPAYTGGPKLADGGEIEVKDTGVPIELDRIYASLSDLTTALGPNGVNQDGTLNNVLKAGSKFLDGRGRQANTTIVNLSRAMKTFGDGSGDLFGTVEALNQFTGALAQNDAAVSQFIGNLSAVSTQLADEKDELFGALKNLAEVLGKVEGFVKGNRGLLVRSVKDLGRVLKTIASEKVALETVLEVGPVAMGNLVNAWDPVTSTIGSRIGLGNNVVNLDDVLCSAIQGAKLPVAGQACALLKELLKPLRSDGAKAQRAAPGAGAGAGKQSAPDTSPKLGSGTAAGNLGELLGGGS